LVESFKSTLEEAADSDFLIHVIDNTAEDLGTHYDTVKSLVRQLGMENIPSVVFFNKTDMDAGRYYLPSETHEYIHKHMDPGYIEVRLHAVKKKLMEPYRAAIPLAETQKLYDHKRHTIVEEEVLQEVDEEYRIKGYEPEGSWSKRIVQRNGE